MSRGNLLTLYKIRNDLFGFDFVQGVPVLDIEFRMLEQRCYSLVLEPMKFTYHEQFNVLVYLGSYLPR